MILPIFRQPTIIPSAMPYNLRMQTSGDDDLKRFLQWLAENQSLDGVPPSGTEQYREALLKLESKDYLNRIFNPDFSGVDLLAPRLLFTDLYKYPNDPSGAGWLQEALGYVGFFIMVMICCLATVSVTWFARRRC